MKRMILLTTVLSLALAALGCGADDGRIEVSGTVTWEGKPLSSGTIAFTPADDNPSPAAGGAIKNGRFRIPARTGPGSGAYKVVVTNGDLPNKRDVLGTKRPAGSATPRLLQNGSCTFTCDLDSDGSATQLEFEFSPPAAE